MISATSTQVRWVHINKISYRYQILTFPSDVMEVFLEESNSRLSSFDESGDHINRKQTFSKLNKHSSSNSSMESTSSSSSRSRKTSVVQIKSKEELTSDYHSDDGGEYSDDSDDVVFATTVCYVEGCSITEMSRLSVVGVTETEEKCLVEQDNSDKKVNDSEETLNDVNDRSPSKTSIIRSLSLNKNKCLRRQNAIPEEDD